MAEKLPENGDILAHKHILQLNRASSNAVTPNKTE